MARRQEVYVVKLTHTCEPDQGAVEQGLHMWAAFLAENRRRKPRSGKNQPSPEQAG